MLLLPRAPLLVLLSGILIWNCGRPVEHRVAPAAGDGTLDLQRWDFARFGAVALKGQWRFSPDNLVSPVRGAADGSDALVKVPALWTEYKFGGKSFPTIGKASFSLDVRLPPDSPPLALRIAPMDTAYILFVNGREIARNANLNVSAPEPSYYAPVVVKMPPGESLRLVLHMANAYYSRPGLRDAPLLGTEVELRSAADRALWFEVLLIGALVIMCLYHLGLVALRTGDRPAAYFALCSGIIMIRLMVTGEGFAFRITPIVWRLSTFLEYLSFYTAVPTLMMFLVSLYPAEAVRFLTRASLVICGCFCAFVCAAPLMYYTQSLPYF